MKPSLGEFVEVRSRPWLVEGIDEKGSGLTALRLSCISDDAQGEVLEVAWEAEIGARTLEGDPWSLIAENGTDDPSTFAAYLRTLKWNTATAADRDLFQAPFRAGIRLDAYQLLPLRKALRLPRVNLLIADDVGLGKTIEAGLILRELLLRRRIDFALVAAPPSMTLQWKDELEAKFGLSFTIIDRERLAEMRRQRGFGVNPWATASRYIVSHRLLTDETYTAGLRDVLGAFRPRALLILDEAHHAAPASGARYAVDSQFTKAMRDLAGRFEHRLFLTATPHNGHSNSFSSLLEMLDPQRFTRGVEVRPRDLDPVMVRRLKSDLRRIGESFPERVVDPILLEGLPATAPELRLSGMLSDYGALRAKRIARLPRGEANQAKLVFVGLQQRLLSSVAAFARSLEVHRRTLLTAIEHATRATPVGAGAAFVVGAPTGDELPLSMDEATAVERLAADEDAAVMAATDLGAIGATGDDLRAELAHIDDTLAFAKQHANKADARVVWLVRWIRDNMLSEGMWNDRRLILFTEYEDTRRWLQRRLAEALADTDRPDDRVGVFSGATGGDQREEIKRAFNADPAVEPLRILICTDAAREGINLQARCHDLIHIDLPWNPSRLEQRNGRIDRKLQPSPTVFCRYFRYAQREEDIVLDALVWKTERIRTQLGSAGRVIEERVFARLAENGIERGRAQALADRIRDENDDERLTRARAEMDDDERARYDRILKDNADLRHVLEESRKRVGVNPRELRQVVGVALARAGADLEGARGDPVGPVDTFRFDPSSPVFAADPGWLDAFDDLRPRPRRRGERFGEWRQAAPIRSIAFEPPIQGDGSDAANVVQVHLEHRLVRRLLSRFLSQGFQSGLERVCAVIGPGAEPRVVMIGRLAVYGPGAARLHEEFLPVTALWTEAGRTEAGRPGKSLRPFGRQGGETTLAQLEEALRDTRRPPPMALARIRALARRDAQDLEPELRRRAEDRLATVIRDLAARGDEEATSLTKLLDGQRARIAKAEAGIDPNQLSLPGIADQEREQLARDRRHWAVRLREIEREIAEEPKRVRESYTVRAHRIEPVGLVYLWPVSG
ncbi:DISARM system SNF2-like helicase DrmD [Azospirillum sp. HJ39]|uniref:DISARM system SNF2-like helicase DrmD n=1 Tax=Azospirillum sp. HJ39 TaxID=3159496 RepID=UPI00355863A8